MEKSNKGSTGTSCTHVNLRSVIRNVLNAKLEFRRLGRGPGNKKVYRGAKALVRRHIEEGTADIEYRFVLIDYRKENEHIKEKMMTRYEATVKNNLLKGSGFAWAMVNR